jgi:hypothetical protein
MDLKEIGRVGANCIIMTQYRDKWRAVVNTMMSLGTAYIARNLLREKLIVYQEVSCCIQLHICLCVSCKVLFSINLFKQIILFINFRL